MFPEPVRKSTVEADLVADMTVCNPFDFFVDETAEASPFDDPADRVEDLSISRRPEPAGPLLTQHLARLDLSETGAVNFRSD